MSEKSLLDQAREYFTRQEYLLALETYIEVSKDIGLEQVQANITICENRLRLAAKGVNFDELLTNNETVNLATQLASTQSLLEDYYERYQQLRIKSLPL